jgi:hypothetical protein
VIRSWDPRRIVVPITYFLDHPFQNWSRRSQQLIMPVYVYTDYRIDVEAVRNEVKAILEESPDWDRTVGPNLQVTACKDETSELRALCSARDPAANWNLRCHVPERLVRFIQGLEAGRYLPRTRVAMVPAGEEPVVSDASLHDNGKPDGPMPATYQDHSLRAGGPSHADAHSR